jgi:hypothetical protein
MIRRLIALAWLVPSLAGAAPLVASNGDDVASLAAFCKTLDAATTCAIADDDKIADLAKPVAPYLAARIFWAGASVTQPNNTCYVGIQTKGSWTVASLGIDCWGNGKYFRRLVVGELAVRATGHLWLRYTVESSDPGVDGTVTEDYLVICRMAEAQPRCTDPIALGSATDRKPTWKVNATLSKAGALVLTLAKGKRAALPAETAARLGKSTLSFE